MRKYTLFLIFLFLMPSTTTDAGLGLAYRYTLQRFTDTNGSDTTNTLSIILHDSPEGGVGITQGGSFSLLVTNSTVFKPFATSQIPANQTMLSNGTLYPDRLIVQSYNRRNALFRFQTNRVSTYFSDGYDAQGFVVNQTAFKDLAGSEFTANASAFGIVTMQDKYIGNIRFQTHIEEYYEWGSGMLLEFKASRIGISNDTIVRQMDLVLKRTSTSNSSLDYYPMIIAALPLILLRKRLTR